MQIKISERIHSNNEQFLKLEYIDPDVKQKEIIREYGLTDSRRVLGRIFGDHGDLFDFLNIEIIGRHRGTHFDYRGTEMADLVLKMDKDHYNKLFEKMGQHLTEFFENKKNTSNHISLNVEGESLNFNKIIDQNQIILTEDGAYNLELKKINYMDGISKFKGNLYNVLKNDMKKDVRLIENQYKRDVNQIKMDYDRKLENEKNNIFKKTIDVLKNYDLVVKDGQEWFKYKNRIYINQVVNNELKYEYQENDLYVDGLIIKNVPNNPSVDLLRSRHPHITGHDICTGDLNGCNLDKMLKELPESLKIANMNSLLNMDVGHDLYKWIEKNEPLNQKIWSL